MIINEIWVYGDIRNEKLFDSSLKVLGKVCEIAKYNSLKALMIILGDSQDINVLEAASQSVKYGANKVYILQNDIFSIPKVEIYSKAISEFIKTKNPALVTFALTDFGRDLASRIARINNAGLIADCIDLKIFDKDIISSCPSWGGEVMAEITFSNPLKTGYATVFHNSLKKIEVFDNKGIIEKIQIDVPASWEKLKLVERTFQNKEHQKLEEAEIVVVGGSGLGNSENFGYVRSLAAALGGEVGATRPPVLLHWVEDVRLIGQTGKNIRPNLLISIGTSGAIQYTAGVMESKTIVAINRDHSSPIFNIADIGIIADAKTILPLLIDCSRKLLMRKLSDAISKDREVKNNLTSLGLKIFKLRQAHDWSLETLAEATGQSPEFISQIEDDSVTPSVAFLLRLARCLKVDPAAFLNEEEKTAIKDQRVQAFTRRTRNYSYQTLTPSAENEHLKAFMITIESMQSHKPVAYKHEGEEFVFIMTGELELTVGNKIHHLKQGESIHFNSEIPHKLKNLSDETTRCLVVLYTP